MTEDQERADDDVRDLLRALTPRPEVGIDPDAVRRSARRRRSRRAILSTAVAVTVVPVVAAVLPWSGRPGGGDPAPAATSNVPSDSATPESGIDATPGWEVLPDMPLSPRSDPMTVWTGTEVLVIGGSDRSFVGGPIPFPRLRDGAAYDPVARTWRPLDDAPEPIGSHSYGPATLVGDTVVIKQSNTWLAYDVAADAWRELPSPPVRRLPQPTLAGDPSTGRLYAIDVYRNESEAPVQVLDLATDTWTALPASEHGPPLDDRSLAWTDVGLVLLGHRGAERWDGQRWVRYPRPDVVGGRWHWTGERVVSTYRSTGRSRFPAGSLDPTTGTWAALPPLPVARPDLISPGHPQAGGPLVLHEGYLYDDATGTTTPIPAPDPDLGGSGVVVADGSIMSFGGFRLADGEEFMRAPSDVDLTAEVWSYALG